MRFRKISGCGIAVLLVILTITNLRSQNEEIENKISIGFEIGPQFTSVSDSYAYSVLPKSKVGFNAGIFGEYKLTDLVKVRLGAYYDNRGFKGQDFISPISELQDDDSVYVSYASYYSEDLNYTLNYLTIPISIIYSKGNEKFSFFLQGSLYYSLLLNASVNGTTDLYIYPEHAPKFEDPELQVPGNTITEYDNKDITNNFTSNDWGVQLFFGFIYNINSKIGLQISPGLTVGFQNLYANPSRVSKWNNVYKINAGIVYKLN